MSVPQLHQFFEFDPAAPLDDALKQVPARWAVYLFADAADRPIQLLCVKNLRASLKRRLEGEETQFASKRVKYREIARRVHYTRVDSALEADLVYLDAARAAFPQNYAKLTGLRPAWFVHIDPTTLFPRYRKTTDLTASPGELFGPIDGKEHAQKLTELMEDWFDLCRYYDVLVRSPMGRACAYKEMGRCPAPCDGSISVEQYRRLVRYSLSALADPRHFIGVQQERMKHAAAELRFESASKIQKYIESLSVLGAGPYRHLRRLQNFRYVSFQRGPRAKTVNVFLITPARARVIISLLGEPTTASSVIRLTLQTAEQWCEEPIDAAAIERLGVVAHHLFWPKAQGVTIPLDELDDRALIKAFRDVVKQKSNDETVDEGVVKEFTIT